MGAGLLGSRGRGEVLGTEAGSSGGSERGEGAGRKAGLGAAAGSWLPSLLEAGSGRLRFSAGLDWAPPAAPPDLPSRSAVAADAEPDFGRGMELRLTSDFLPVPPLARPLERAGAAEVFLSLFQALERSSLAGGAAAGAELLRAAAGPSAQPRISKPWAEPSRSLSLPEASAGRRYFSMSRALGSRALGSKAAALLCSAFSRALRSAGDRAGPGPGAGPGAGSGAGPGAEPPPAGRRPRSRLFLDSSTIMAASWAGSELREASAMAVAMALTLRPGESALPPGALGPSGS